MGDDTQEYPVERDGERRGTYDRRRSARVKRRVTHGLGWASGVAALLIGLKTLGEIGGSALHLAIAAQQLNAAVSALEPRVGRDELRTDTVVVNEGLIASHLAKLDTITLQEQQAIQALTVRVDHGRRSAP